MIEVNPNVGILVSGFLLMMGAVFLFQGAIWVTKKVIKLLNRS